MPTRRTVSHRRRRASDWSPTPRDALRHADDPARFDHAIATGENTLRRQGQLAGKPEAAIDGEIAAWRSARYVEAVHALAPNDGLGATALFERYRDQLTPADRAALEPLLHEPTARIQAIADIDTAALAAAPFAPLTPQGDPLLADRMRTITSHFDRVVLPELMQRYGGDAARAWAATQIGTDAVDALVKQHGDGWYQALPEAARNAVAHNFALLRADSSARTAPQDRAAVEASLAGLDDTRRGYAQRELTLRSNRADQARRAAQGAAADQAYELADQLGHDFTSLAQLPAKVRAELSDQTSAALQRQADANIDPHPVAPEGVVSLALRNMATTAPEAFRDLDMREYRPLVSVDEYAMFERVQRGLVGFPDRRPHLAVDALLQPDNTNATPHDTSFGAASQFDTRNTMVSLDSQSPQRSHSNSGGQPDTTSSPRNTQSGTSGSLVPDTSLKISVDKRNEKGPDSNSYTVDSDGDGIPDAYDADPTDSSVTKQEHVTDGVRVDTTDRDETLLERQYLLMPPYVFTNQWVNAEHLPSGQWLIKKADNPTSDQIRFKANYDAVHRGLWGELSDNTQISFASALTDRGFNLADEKIDIVRLYFNYKDLLSSGKISGKNADDFINWIYKTQPKSKLPK